MSKRKNNTTNTSISAVNTNTQDKWYSKFVKSNATKQSHHQKLSPTFNKRKTISTPNV